MVFASRVMHLEGPLRVDLVDAYGDGTFWASIADRRDRRVHVCWDGRVGSATRYRLFEGARHPRGGDAALVDLGADEEGLVVALVSRWLDSDDARAGLTEFGREKLIETLLRMGEPAAEPAAAADRREL